MFDQALKAASPWNAKYLVIGFAAGGIPKASAPGGYPPSSTSKNSFEQILSAMNFE